MVPTYHLQMKLAKKLYYFFKIIFCAPKNFNRVVVTEGILYVPVPYFLFLWGYH